ncbi:MAG TPA: hypothetical protein VFQ73_07015 [Flavisolibacter sp.]|nr:hypothetical protein [Flavisolibacter sp.]
MEEQKKLRKRKKIQKPKELVYSAKARMATSVVTAATAISSIAAMNFQQLWK